MEEIECVSVVKLEDREDAFKVTKQVDEVIFEGSIADINAMIGVEQYKVDTHQAKIAELQAMKDKILASQTEDKILVSPK